jgi:hypothetical protein
MVMSESMRSDAESQPTRFRFGLKWVIVVVLVFSVVFACVARESHRVKRQARLMNDLAQIGVRVRGGEPTGWSLVARKVLGRRDVWLRQRMDANWFSRPRELVTWTATDQQIPVLIERIEQLGDVRELHLEQSPVTQQGIAVLKSELPTVAVLTRTDVMSRTAAQPKEQFATAAFQLLAIVAGGFLCITIVLIWPLLRWRRNR